MATKKKTFETSLTELEDIVEKLEAGSLGLEESIKLFEQGIELGGVLDKQLSSAEEKISLLKANLNRAVESE
jgi:exodeoxyribonuclease VII small subunit